MPYQSSPVHSVSASSGGRGYPERDTAVGAVVVIVVGEHLYKILTFLIQNIR